MSARVAVAAYPNQPFPGEVVKVEPQAVVEQNVTMFAVLVSIDNRDGLLMPGMNAEVEVSIARSEDVVTVPVMALRTNRDIAATAAILGIDEADLRGLLKSEGATGRGGGGSRGADGKDYRFGGDFWVVMSADPEAGPEIRKVRAGITDLDRVEIIAGLQESESVLILPSTHLFETQQDLQNWLSRRIGVPGIQRR
jgi:HlyD family secretion protein